MDRENRRWIRDLSADGAVRESACNELYALLLRVARSEARRRARALRLIGPELEDIAHQAAADALMAVTKRLDRFRGESKFTTWATKFVIFDVANKVKQHFWQRHEVPYQQDDWSRLAARFDLAPEEIVQVRELADVLSKAVEQDLSARQREVFVATVFNGTPIGVLADELDSSPNALYKVLFDARKKLRGALQANGHTAKARSA